MVFTRHYAGSTACSPSRATLFTGQYPSLHGVTQTQGIAKKSQDPDMFWLQPNTVPTMGDYFKQAGYQTFYKGK
jgi:arylsulfatase A-like enzyme